MNKKICSTSLLVHYRRNNNMTVTSSMTVSIRSQVVSDFTVGSCDRTEAGLWNTNLCRCGTELALRRGNQTTPNHSRMKEQGLCLLQPACRMGGTLHGRLHIQRMYLMPSGFLFYICRASSSYRTDCIFNDQTDL